MVVLPHVRVDILEQTLIIYVLMNKNGFPADILMTVETGVGVVGHVTD